MVCGECAASQVWSRSGCSFQTPHFVSLDLALGLALMPDVPESWANVGTYR